MKIHTMIRDEHKHGFFCPACKYVHWFINSKGGWIWNLDIEKPTITPSILTWTANSRCHSFITDGKIKFLNDCTHDMKGQTVDLPDFPGCEVV